MTSQRESSKNPDKKDMLNPIDEKEKLPKMTIKVLEPSEIDENIIFPSLWVKEEMKVGKPLWEEIQEEVDNLDWLNLLNTMEHSKWSLVYSVLDKDAKESIIKSIKSLGVYEQLKLYKKCDNSG